MSLPILVLWGLLGALLAARGLAVWRDVREIVAPPTLVTAGFVALYGVSALALGADDRHALLSPDGYLRLVTLAVLSAGAVTLGARLRPPRPPGPPPPRAPTPSPVSPALAVGAAVLLGAIAAAGWAVFLARSGGVVAYYGAPHGTAGAWEETSAYLYRLQFFVYPALVLLWGLRGEGRLSRVGYVALVGLTAGVVLDGWWHGSRATWLRLLLVWAVPVLLGPRARRPSRLAVSLVLAGGLALTVLTPYVREAMYLHTPESLAALTARAVTETNPLRGSTGGEGNELLFAAALVASAARTDTLTFGERWLYPVIGFVPRAWWPDKPYIADWSVNYAYLVWWGEGWRVARGATPTGLADTFVQFGWATPAVWLLLGVWGGRLWRRARHRRDLPSLGAYTAYAVGLVFFLAQDFVQAFHFWAPFAGPIWAVARVGHLRRGLVRWTLRPWTRRALAAERGH